MSTAMVFGLAFSTVLTLVFCPVMLSAPAVWKESWQRLRARFGKSVDGEEGKTSTSGKPEPADAEQEAYPQAAE
jgi:multidrug efflux pump